MSAVIVVAIVVIVLLAAAMLLSATKASRDGLGHGRALPRDAQARTRRAARPSRPRFEDGHRSLGSRRPWSSPARAAPWWRRARRCRPCGPTGSRDHRCDPSPVPQPLDGRGDGLAITTFAAAAFTAFLCPPQGWLRRQDRHRKITTSRRRSTAAKGFLYKPEGRMWVVPYPDTALPKAQVAYGKQTCYPAACSRHRRLVAEVPPPRLPRPELQHLHVVRVPVPRFAVQPRGREEGRPGSRGMDRFGVEVSGDGVVTVNTGDVNQGPPIGTNTTGQEAEGPHCADARPGDAA